MLILTLLTGIVVLAFLIVLGWALAKIAHALEAIIGNLEKIAMGVRVIERETAPLCGEIATLNRAFEALDGRFDAITGNLLRAVE